MPLRWALAVTLSLSLAGTCSVAHEAKQDEAQAADDGKKKAAVEIRKRWTAADVVRDLEHVKEDMKKMFDLQVNGELADEEFTFYYFRMHDFDDNNLLDGHELMVAARHTIEHHLQEDETMEVDDIIQQTDRTMVFDKDHDGFISYPEMRATIRD